MYKRIISLLLAVLLCVGGAGSAAALQVSEKAEEARVGTGTEQIAYGFADANGVKIEYGIYGLAEGEPLLLLPPNGGDMHAFDGNVLPELARHYKVITVSPRGMGNSDRGEGKLTFEVMADDLVYLLDSLGVASTNVFGFSDGGNLGFVFTLRHPAYVRRLAVMGSNINTAGTKTSNQIGIVLRFLFLSLKAKITGDPADALARDIEGMMVGQPKLTFDDLSQIQIPVLNIYGENDMIKRIHSKRITRSIENCQELMVVGGGHSSCFDQTDTVLNPALLAFFGDGAVQ